MSIISILQYSAANSLDVGTLSNVLLKREHDGATQQQNALMCSVAKKRTNAFTVLCLVCGCRVT